ncbi:eCIS core domain-containing protein [Cellulomonas fimi]|uniref:eCIS core domain-containing protein n=1 Tax=Cellulomonas fimi TaxID=1708 RepID=UPI002359DAB0|nr:DUF4157 domain-containing protein [Cellulomonas fimi]
MTRSSAAEPHRRSAEQVAAEAVGSASAGALPHRRELERAFAGHDLATIRVADPGGGAAARARVRAHAFTVGDAVSLPPGASLELTAHEVVHALQNRAAAAGRGGDGVRAEEHAVGVAAGVARGASGGGPTRGPVDVRGAVAAGAGVAPPAARTLHRAPNQAGTTDPQHVLDFVDAQTGSPGEVLDALSEAHGGNADRYFYTDTYGWVDIRHFGAAASYAASTGSVVAEGLGLLNEGLQWATEWGDSYRSGFSPEDIPSNAAGAEFGDDFVGSREGESLHDALARWMTHAGARPASDEHAHREALPATDPAVRGGAARGSSNASRDQISPSQSAEASADAAEHSFMQLFDWRNYARMYGMQVP